MRREPITIAETDTLGAAQRAMARNEVRHLPVVSNGKLVGILNEHDVLTARSRVEEGDDWWRISVHDAMQPPQTASLDDSITEIAGRMAASKIDAFPVVSLGKLLGIVTVTDVLEAEVRMAMGPHQGVARAGGQKRPALPRPKPAVRSREV